MVPSNKGELKVVKPGRSVTAKAEESEPELEKPTELLDVEEVPKERRDEFAVVEEEGV